MARAVLLAGAVVWLLAGVAGIGLALVGTEAIEQRLPPLAIDTEALRATIMALGAAGALAAALHLGVLAALRGGGRRALSSAVLLAGMAGALLAVLAVAALTRASVDPEMRMPLIAAGLGGFAAASVYLAAAWGFARELRIRPRRPV